MAPLVSQDASEEVVTRILSAVKVPEYRPSEKVSRSSSRAPRFTFTAVRCVFPCSVSNVGAPLQCIETDETAKKPDLIKASLSSEEEREAIMQLEEAISSDCVTSGVS